MINFEEIQENVHVVHDSKRLRLLGRIVYDSVNGRIFIPNTRVGFTIDQLEAIVKKQKALGKHERTV